MLHESLREYLFNIILRMDETKFKRKKINSLKIKSLINDNLNFIFDQIYQFFNLSVSSIV